MAVRKFCGKWHGIGVLAMGQNVDVKTVVCKSNGGCYHERKKNWLAARHGSGKIDIFSSSFIPR